MIETLSAASERFFKDEPTFIETKYHDSRLWMHNAIHTILDLNATARNEAKVSISQAVLLRSPKVGIKREPLTDGGIDVTLNDIQTITMPGIENFLQYLAQKFHHRIIKRLDNDSIKDTFTKAGILSSLIQRDFGCHLGQIPVNDLRQVPFEKMTGLVRESEKLWEMEKSIIPVRSMELISK